MATKSIYSKVLFQGFKDRDQDLRKVTRAGLYDVMLYRTNLYTHSHRVAALTRVLNPLAASVFGKKYDPIKAEVMAYIHDDAEIVFGDIPASYKAKMNPEQLQEVVKLEEESIHKVAQRFPTKVGGYSYEKLLTESANKSSLEAQVVCYADKYDALGEVLHEIYAGNYIFITTPSNEHGDVPAPIDYYYTYFQTFPDKYPDMKPILALQAPMLRPVPKKDYASAVASSKPHTLESLSVPTDDFHYNIWKQTVLEIKNDEVVRDLYVQKEFLSDR